MFASLWALTIFMNTVVARWFGEMAFMRGVWPFPGLLSPRIGVVSSLLMTVLARRLSGKPILVDVGAGYLVLQCLLIAILGPVGAGAHHPASVLGLHPDSVLPRHRAEHSQARPW